MILPTTIINRLIADPFMKFVPWKYVYSFI